MAFGSFPLELHPSVFSDGLESDKEKMLLRLQEGENKKKDVIAIINGTKGFIYSK